MARKMLCIIVFIYSCVIIVTAQSQNVSRTINPRAMSRQRAPVSQQRGGSNTVQRRGLTQLRGRLTPGRPTINLQNLARDSGRIPRARSFQASLPNTVPTRMDPRLARRIRGMPARNQRTSRVAAGSRATPRTRNQNALLSSICAAPRSVRCYSWPRNQDPRGAYMCDGRCRGRTCPIACECSCVDPRLLGRLRAVGRISGPELTLIDTRLTDAIRRQQLRNRILALRASRQRGAQTQQGTRTNRRGRPNELPQARNTVTDLNFGISDDVLATLIAQPALNEIVGPQGINQILAGEPPLLLSRDNRRQGSSTSSLPTNTIRQPDIRAIETTSARAQQRAEIPAQNPNMGIPVPLSRLNFDPGTSLDPALGDMRVMMTDIRPFRDATTGLNIDLPNPTPLDLNPASMDNAVSVRQLPGTNVLFVDLSRSSPSIQGSSTALQVRPTQVGAMTERTRNAPNFVNNFTSDILSTSVNNAFIPSSNQTLPGSRRSEFGGSFQTFIDGAVQATDPRVRAPTMDECLAQRLQLWCDPQKPWDGTPGLSRWCLLNCRADNCDNQRCACACIEEILFKTKFEQLKSRPP